MTVNGSTYFLNGGVVTVCATQGHAYAGNICTRCKINPVTYSASVVSTWLKSNGSYVDGDYLYGFDLPTQSGGVMYVSYDTTQNMVYLTSEICHEDGSSNIVIVIVGTGEFGVSSDPDDLSKYAEIYGTLDLPKYTKSGKLSFTEYAGDRSLETNLKEEARYAVSDTVEYYGYFLKEAVGMSLYDAGFRSFR